MTTGVAEALAEAVPVRVGLRLVPASAPAEESLDVLLELLSRVRLFGSANAKTIDKMTYPMPRPTPNPTANKARTPRPIQSHLRDFLGPLPPSRAQAGFSDIVAGSVLRLERALIAAAVEGAM